MHSGHGSAVCAFFGQLTCPGETLEKMRLLYVRILKSSFSDRGVWAFYDVPRGARASFGGVSDALCWPGRLTVRGVVVCKRGCRSWACGNPLFRRLQAGRVRSGGRPLGTLLSARCCLGALACMPRGWRQARKVPDGEARCVGRARYGFTEQSLGG